MTELKDITLSTYYPNLLHSMGLPFRLSGKRIFPLKSVIGQYNINNDKIVSVKKQIENYRIAGNDEPGWLMYLCANGVIDNARHVAANLMHIYHRRDLRAHWITSVDNVRTIDFSKLRLVIIDALFFDSSSYRRDRIYELINHNCNVPNQSIIVIGQNTDPFAMSNQLGMKPNLAMLTK